MNLQHEIFLLLNNQQQNIWSDIKTKTIMKREVFIQWMNNCQSEFQVFQSRIYTQFQRTFADIEQLYQDKYQGIIDNQQQQIKQLKSKLGTFQKIQQLINGAEHKNHIIPDQIEVHHNQSFQQQEEIHQLQQQQQQIHSNNIFNENRNIEGQKEQIQPQLQQNLFQQREKLDLRQLNLEQEEVEKRQIELGQQNDSQQVMNQQQSYHVQPVPRRQHPHQLPLLQRRQNHYMCKVSLIPNFTSISFIEYQPYQAWTFDQNNMLYLQNHDLRQVESIKIQGLEMNDKFFERVTKLQWGNIISLQVDGNFLTNLDPIKNLPYKEFVHLDISNNELNTSSAQFLASRHFDSLIYLTLSCNFGIIITSPDGDKRVMLVDFTYQQHDQFPQALGSSNQLNDMIIDHIKQCMRKKSIEQRQRQVINQVGQMIRYYPQNYQIKIRWEQSNEMLVKMSKKQVEQMNKKWREQVKYKSCDAPKFYRQKESSAKRLANKRKHIHKSK